MEEHFELIYNPIKSLNHQLIQILNTLEERALCEGLDVTFLIAANVWAYNAIGSSHLNGCAVIMDISIPSNKIYVLAMSYKGTIYNEDGTTETIDRPLIIMQYLNSKPHMNVLKPHLCGILTFD